MFAGRADTGEGGCMIGPIGIHLLSVCWPSLTGSMNNQKKGGSRLDKSIFMRSE